MQWLDMAAVQRTATVANVLYREGHALDTRQWEAWLELYDPNCEYWVPAWRNEEEPTSDPEREVSLIHYASRAGLEDRVWRVKSGLSAASKLLPRTQHQITNVELLPAASESAPPDGDEVSIRYNWSVNQFECDTQISHTFFGRAEATLVFREGSWLFVRKKILILNEYIPTVLDFYSI